MKPPEGASNFRGELLNEILDSKFSKSCQTALTGMGGIIPPIRQIGVAHTTGRCGSYEVSECNGSMPAIAFVNERVAEGMR